MTHIKHFFASIVFFSLFLSSEAQYIIDWDNPIPVTELDLDNNRPKISLDSDNNPLVIWGQDAGKQILFSRHNGSSFDDPQLLLPDGFEIFTSDWAGPDMASSGDDVFVVFKRFPQGEHGVYQMSSNDGGMTWSDTLRVDDIEIGDEQTRLPSVVVDDSGNPAVSFMTYTGNYIDPKYEITTSSDGGQTFGPNINASTDFFPGEACDCCSSDLVWNDDKLVQLYRNNVSNIREIRATVSDDWGLSIGDSFVLDNTDTFSNVCFSSGPDGIINNGILTTAFRANLQGGYRTTVTEYDLEANELISEVSVDLDLPAGVNQHNAKIAGNEMFQLVLWEEFTAANSNVVYSFSTSGAPGFQMWHDTLNVETNGRQVNPDVAFANNEFHVVWQDKFTSTVMYRKGTVVEGTSVEEENAVTMEVYPNPASEMTYLNSEFAGQLRIFDLTGKLAIDLRVNRGLNRLDISSLDEGIYHGLVLENGKQGVFKLIKR